MIGEQVTKYRNLFIVLAFVNGGLVLLYYLIDLYFRRRNENLRKIIKNE